MYVYLYTLIQTLEGIYVQSLFAGLQTGYDFLTLNLSRSDGESREASPEILSEPRLGHLPTCRKQQQTDKTVRTTTIQINENNFSTFYGIITEGHVNI